MYMPIISMYEAKQWGYPSNYFVHAILIDRKMNNKDAIQWLKKNNYIHKYARVSGKHIKYIQTNAVYEAVLSNRHLTPNIVIVYQKYK